MLFNQQIQIPQHIRVTFDGFLMSEHFGGNHKSWRYMKSIGDQFLQKISLGPQKNRVINFRGAFSQQAEGNIRVIGHHTFNKGAGIIFHHAAQAADGIGDKGIQILDQKGRGQIIPQEFLRFDMIEFTAVPGHFDLLCSEHLGNNDLHRDLKKIKKVFADNLFDIVGHKLKNINVLVNRKAGRGQPEFKHIQMGVEPLIVNAVQCQTILKKQ